MESVDQLDKLDNLDVFHLAESLADRIWELVQTWDGFARDTDGRQLVRAGDGIGANIVEGVRRYHFRDNARFVRYARGSLYETRFWLRRAYRRRLLDGDEVNHYKGMLDELAPRLNAYHRSLVKRGSQPIAN